MTKVNDAMQVDDAVEKDLPAWARWKRRRVGDDDDALGAGTTCKTGSIRAAAACAPCAAAAAEAAGTPRRTATAESTTTATT
jgi:hypothetical protein